jgi:hypothetical protein
LRPSEYSVLLLDRSRHRPKSSSSGISRSFRVRHPLEYRPYWFCDPALPLARCLGCAVFLARAAADDSYVIGRVLSSNLTFPLECYPATPTRPPQRPSPLMGFRSLQHSRNPRSTLRGLAGPLRSAFRVWLPSWRLAPSDPAPVLFHTGGAPGIYPSKVSSPARFRQPFGWEEPTYRWPSGFFRRRSVRPARRASVSGFTPLGIALRPHGVLGRGSPAPPLGFAPLGSAVEDLAPDFSGAPLACLAGTRDCSRYRPAPQSVYRPSPRPARPSPECPPAEATLMGFLHLYVPGHSNSPVPGLLSSPPAGSCITVDSPTVFGHLPSSAEAVQDRP